MKNVLIVVLIIASLTLAGGLLFWFFVGSQIKDGGRMENPEADRAGKELVEFSWYQNHMNYDECFSLQFYLEKDQPMLTGWFTSREDGESRENGTDERSNPIPWPLTWVQWFELQNGLTESDLPEFQEPSPYELDGTLSQIQLVWRLRNQEITETYNGRDASELKDLVFRIAEEAYAGSQQETVPLPSIERKGSPE